MILTRSRKCHCKIASKKWGRANDKNCLLRGAIAILVPRHPSVVPSILPSSTFSACCHPIIISLALPYHFFYILLFEAQSSLEGRKRKQEYKETFCFFHSPPQPSSFNIGAHKSAGSSNTGEMVGAARNFCGWTYIHKDHIERTYVVTQGFLFYLHFSRLLNDIFLACSSFFSTKMN